MLHDHVFITPEVIPWIWDNGVGFKNREMPSVLSKVSGSQSFLLQAPHCPQQYVKAANHSQFLPNKTQSLFIIKIAKH